MKISSLFQALLRKRHTHTVIFYFHVLRLDIMWNKTELHQKLFRIFALSLLLRRSEVKRFFSFWKLILHKMYNMISWIANELALYAEFYDVAINCRVCNTINFFYDFITERSKANFLRELQSVSEAQRKYQLP